MRRKRAVLGAAEIDLERPGVSRIYDHHLSGFHNFEADRSLARRAIGDWPDLPLIMGANRAFVRRAAAALVGRGVRRFLELDPVAVLHGREILTDNPLAASVRGDRRRPTEILADPEVTCLLDLSRPVAVLMVAVLHFVSDQDRGPRCSSCPTASS